MLKNQAVKVANILSSVQAKSPLTFWIKKLLCYIWRNNFLKAILGESNRTNSQ